MPIDMQELLEVMRKPASFQEVRKNVTSPESKAPEPVKEFKSDFELDDDGEEYMSVGSAGLLAASEKLLAMNRGLVGQDERDSLRYQKIIRPAGMFRERIKMDSGKLSRQVMYQCAKRRNLSGLLPSTFDGYIDAVLRGNPLTSPLEEINPMQLVENARRITKMGPGGIPSSDSITEEAQAVHPSQFGFIDIIAGPECLVDNDEYKTRILTKEGWKRIKDIGLDDYIACKDGDKLSYNKPEKVTHEPYSGELYTLKLKNIEFAVTPNHRFLCGSNPSYGEKFEYAKDIYQKTRHIPCMPGVYDGVKKGSVEIGDRVYDAKDWCAFLGWFLSEGSLRGKQYAHPSICITQSEDIHPKEYNEIVELCKKMNIKFSETMSSPDNYNKHGYTKHIGVNITEKGIQEYIKERWVNGSYDKWIPEEIFDWGVDERRALLDTLLLGDGRVNDSHTCYCTVCKQLAEDVERLAIGLGYCTRIRIEADRREHVKTVNYCVYLLKSSHRATYSNWNKIDNYDGEVHCVTVPGSCIYLSVNNCPGFWSGNSERAGIDVRAAWGTRVGSNGRIYQQFYDRKKKKMIWMNPGDVSGLTLKLPD